MTDTPPICLVTSWETPCGIAEHSAMLIEAVRAADPTLRFEIMHADNGARPPHPETVRSVANRWPIVHLNYHAALHSLYTPDWVVEIQKQGCKVVITFHDTGVPNSDLAKALCRAADAFIIHEPADDLPKSHYWRMGVPGWPTPRGITQGYPWLGTIGFPFPWKHYDKLAEVTALCGWGFFVIAPSATDEQITAWSRLNPHVKVNTDFIPRAQAISHLAECDATAFTYVTHNTGQSGAVLQGIAARKPVIALKTCRQFRALYEDPIGRATIKWAETFEDVAAHLRNIKIQRCDPGIVALAEQDSWTKLGKKYADLYRSLL